MNRNYELKTYNFNPPTTTEFLPTNHTKLIPNSNSRKSLCSLYI